MEVFVNDTMIASRNVGKLIRKLMGQKIPSLQVSYKKLQFFFSTFDGGKTRIGTPFTNNA